MSSPRNLLPGEELAHQRNHRGLIEQAPEGVGDVHGEPAAGVICQVVRRIEAAQSQDRRRAEGDLGQQIDEVGRTAAQPFERQVEEVVDIGAKQFRIRSGKRLVAFECRDIAVPPCLQEAPQVRVEKQRRCPFPAVVDRTVQGVREAGVRQQGLYRVVNPLAAVVPGRSVQRMRPVGERQARQKKEKETVTGSDSRSGLGEAQQRNLLPCRVQVGADPPPPVMRRSAS